MIEKVARTLSEKATSVEQEIELSQKGIVGIGLKSGVICLIVPTNIPNPKILTLTPLNAGTATLLKHGWHCDFVLKSATEASMASILRISATNASNASGADGGDYLVKKNGRLYQGKSGLASKAEFGKAIAASGTYVASKSWFVPLNWIASIGSGGEQYKLLKISTGIKLASGGAVVAANRNIKYAFEVRGY